MSKEVSMLTTIDNPFNPFTQFDQWYRYDVDSGYNTCSFIARLARTSDELSEEDEELEINRTLKEITSFNILGIYKIVTEIQE